MAEVKLRFSGPITVFNYTGIPPALALGKATLTQL